MTHDLPYDVLEVVVRDGFETYEGYVESAPTCWDVVLTGLFFR